MSKVAAIDVAVRLQLAADNKPSLNYSRLMGGNAQTGYEYDDTSLQTFLAAVANRLRLDTPAWSCAWESMPLDRCLNARHAVLLEYIATATKRSEGGA